MNRLARWWDGVQGLLFRGVAAGLDERLTELHGKLMSVLEVVRAEEHVGRWARSWTGRPPCDRRPLARAFIAKVVYNAPTTVAFLERLRTDRNLCRICGWDPAGEVPSETTFPRAFGELAKQGLGDRVLAALVAQHVQSLLVGHVARDSAGDRAGRAGTGACADHRLARVPEEAGRHAGPCPGLPPGGAHGGGAGVQPLERLVRCPLRPHARSRQSAPASDVRGDHAVRRPTAQAGGEPTPAGRHEEAPPEPGKGSRRGPHASVSPPDPP